MRPGPVAPDGWEAVSFQCRRTLPFVPLSEDFKNFISAIGTGADSAPFQMT